MEMKQNQTFFHGAYSNLTPYLSLSKNIRTFHWLLKSKYLSFTIKVDRNNRNETKSDIFHGTYSNLTPCLFLSKIIKIFQWLSKSKFITFMTKVKPNNGNKTKSDIFLWDIFKSDTISFFTKKYCSISMTFKIEISQF